MTAINAFLEAQNQKPPEERSTLGKPELFFLEVNSFVNTSSRE